MPKSWAIWSSNTSPSLIKPRSKAAQKSNTRIRDAQTTSWNGLMITFASTNRSPIRSPIHVRCVISLTNSLTNSPIYIYHPQISHLTVLKFAHQFAPSSVRRLTAILAHARAQTNVLCASYTSQQVAQQLNNTRIRDAQTICVKDRNGSSSKDSSNLISSRKAEI